MEEQTTLIQFSGNACPAVPATSLNCHYLPATMSAVSTVPTLTSLKIHQEALQRSASPIAAL